MPRFRVAVRRAVPAAALLLLLPLALTPAAGAASSDRSARAQLDRTLDRARRTAPIAVGDTCLRTVYVPGQGRSCRTDGGMYLVPRRGAPAMFTYGPDVVQTGPSSSPAGGFGTVESIVCSPESSSRHVQLVYLLPADHASGGSNVRGDRYATMVPLLQQGLLDAAAIIDRRAGELAPGARRRLRVACDDDGRPSVRHVVLPRSAASYASAEGGFQQIEDDLREAGKLPEYPDYRDARSRSLRRTLGYYDAEFVPGIAGQGTMFDRGSMIESARRAGTTLSSADPLISRTTRNINNNPPTGSLAIQYGTSNHAGPVPPRFGDLLHELSHTMGAVQSQLPTSSGGGHCIDGLDVMCYDDGGPAAASYSRAACPETAAPFRSEDEQYDCGGDTYFHPAPPAGNPLAAANVWHLGLRANETLSTSNGTSARPRRVGRIRIGGNGTRRIVRWPALAPRTGRSYEIGARRRGSREWTYVTARATSTIPMLRPNSRYDISVAAVDRRGQVGPRRIVRGVRTGRDNTPPPRPDSIALVDRTSTTAAVRFVLPTDNVRTRAYLIERRRGSRWEQLDRLTAPSPRDYPDGSRVTAQVSGLQRGALNTIRIRAVDARGNRSLPSRTLAIRTRR